jgi:co-chaperonin GroES (HSP10)
MMAYTVEQLFPDVTIKEHAAGCKILVQELHVPEKTKGGVFITQDSRDVVQADNCCGKVISVGQCAFRERDTGDRWPGYPWCEVGDYVRFPRFSSQYRIVKDGIRFVYVNDTDIGAVLDEPPTE